MLSKNGASEIHTYFQDLCLAFLKWVFLIPDDVRAAAPAIECLTQVLLWPVQAMASIVRFDISPFSIKLCQFKIVALHPISRIIG